MLAKIELHYCSNHYHLSDHFLRSYLPSLSNTEQAIYLVNDPKRAQQLTEEWYLTQSGSVIGRSFFLGYHQWLLSLADQLNILPPFLSFPERCLLLETIIHHVNSSMQYFHFPGSSFPPDLISKMVLLMDRIRLNDAEREILQRNETAFALNTTDRLQRDFHRLFSAYLDAMHDRYVDEAELLKRIMAQLDTTFLNQFYPRLKDVIYEDISHFQSLHLRFFEHLKSRGIHVFFLLPYGQNQEVFFHKNSLFIRLRHIVDHMEKYHGVDKISNSLFQIKAPKFQFADKFHIFPAANRLVEVENLAAQIKKMVIDQGWPFSVIGVTSPQLPTYSSLLEMVFQRFKIPYSFLDDRILEQIFVIQNLKWLLELVKDGYPRQVVHKILQSPLFSYHEKLSDPAILKVIPSWRVKSGRKEILDFLSREIQRQNLTKWQEEDPQNPPLPFSEIKEMVEELFDEVHFFEKPQTASAIYHYFYTLTRKHKFLEKFAEKAGNGYSEWARENHQALVRFLEDLQRWEEVERRTNSTAKYTVQEFWERFNSLTQFFTAQLRLPSRLGIQIFPFSRLDSQKCKALFVVGMEDGVFPGNPSLNITVPHNLPQNLKGFAFEDQTFWERERFLKLLHFPAERVEFSYARFQKDRPLLPSLFLKELQRISEPPLENPSEIKLYTPARILENMITRVTEEQHIPDSVKEILPDPSYQDFRRLSEVVLRRQGHTFPSEWEGILSSDPAAAGWINRKSQNSSFSPTQLETYARCPMIYFFSRVLRLQPYEELDEFFRSLDKGLILHHILYRFYSQNDPPQRRLSNLIAIAQEELEKFKVADSLLWEIEKADFLGSDGKKGLLPAFWDYEQQVSQIYRTIPQHYEISFGRPINYAEGVDPFSTPNPYVYQSDQENFYFRGKIDRVEIADNGALIVVDYKSGAVPSFQEMWKGEKLQLPIYLRIVYELLKNRYANLHIAGAAFYSIKNENAIDKKLVFAQPEVSEILTEVVKTVTFPDEKYQINGQLLTLDEFIDYIFDLAIRYIQQIREGKFAHTLDQSRCRKHDGSWCDYFPLCRLNWYKITFLKRHQDSISP